MDEAVRETKKTFCRVCHAACAIEVELVDGQPVAFRGDRDDPLYSGYTCIKGRQILDQHFHPKRIRRPLKKMPDGSFTEIPLEQALDEIAAKVAQILEEDGPRSVATYIGTFGNVASAATYLAKGFHNGIGSVSYYSLVTIDQPSKGIAVSRFGFWGGGFRGYSESDVLLVIGCNPIASHSGPAGAIPMYNPSRRYQDFVNRGARVICVDPRYSEVARRAEFYFQIKPGEDPTFLAGMIRYILAEDLYDREFCDRYLDGLDELRAAIEDFTPDYVAKRADIDEAQFLEATRVFASGKVGIAYTGTGPDMSPHSNLTEHLVLVLNTILGRWAREGEVSAYPQLLSPARPRRAEVIPPDPNFGKGPKSRFRGLSQVLGEMPTSALPDEILTPGEGQVKSVFSIGGNPLTAWPDQMRTKRALEELKLLVSIDIRMNETCMFSHYVLPGRTCLEREDVTALLDKLMVYEYPYAHYTKALVEADEEIIDDWEFFWEIARRIGADLPLAGGNVPMDRKPSTLEVMELALPNSRVPLAELRDHDGGMLLEDVKLVVEPGDPDSTARFQATPPGIVDEIREVRTEAMTEDFVREADKGFSHLLISRRLKTHHNSNGRDYEAIRKKGTTNPAFVHPDDLAALGVESGDMVRITGKHGQILGIVEAAADVRRGVVSMAHGWGGIPGNDGNVREVGSATTRLQAADKEYDPIHGMPRQSAIPVNISPVRI